VKVDVTQEADVKALFDRAMQEFGCVDIVVSNAAILIAEPIADADAEKWRAVMNVNVRVFPVTKYGLPDHESAAHGFDHQHQFQVRQERQLRNSPTPPANSAASATRRVSRWRWRRSTCAATPSARHLLDSPLWTHPEKGLFVQYLRAGKVSGAKDIEDVASLHEPGADEARLAAMMISATPSFPRLRPVVVYHRHRPERDRRPGNGLIACIAVTP